ncbi:hypothetical protein THIOSC15_2330002 [uncultured Thiomicrorhabdus sp.]
MARNNFIGLTPQRNDWCSSWISFTGRCAKTANSNGLKRGMSSAIADRGYQLIEKLESFQDYQPHSLLHGDLWGEIALLTAMAMR